jgi:hypothetical protein
MTKRFEGERLHHNATSSRTDVDYVVFERGAVVKAMAICTPHPFIQIFKVRSLLRVLNEDS